MDNDTSNGVAKALGAAATDYFLLRNARDVIKAGPYRVWDSGPVRKWPVQELFFRRAGTRLEAYDGELLTVRMR
jgi:hypothetical protein